MCFWVISPIAPPGSFPASGATCGSGGSASTEGPDPSAVLAAFDTRMAELGRQRSAVADKIADRIDTGLPELLAARSHAWQASLRDLIEPRAGDALAVVGNGTVRSVLEDARGKLEEAGRDVVGAWLERRVGEVQELLTGLAVGEIGELLEMSRSPGVIGAGIAGLAADEDRSELAGWSAEDVPALAVWVPEWAVPVQMPRRSRRKAGIADGEVRRYLEDALTAAIVAFDERARVAFQEAARDWARRLDDLAGRQMREAADRFRRFLQTVPRDEDLVALDDLAGQLAGFQAALGAAEPRRLGEAADAELAPPASPSADGCVVCEQMQATLTDYLRRRQFRLATREGDQERHALAGGFCPLHTWQYAAIASPLGISAGYPKLAAAAADALRRDGDDMRAYALKREALHSGLVTEEESRAHLGALRRLAGLPALTQTWSGTDA